MTETNPGWEERAARFQPSDFQVEIWFPSMNELPEHSQERLTPKLRALESVVRELAYRLYVGTEKYPTDNRTAAEWQELQDEEVLDQVNYLTLRKAMSR